MSVVAFSILFYGGGTVATLVSLSFVQMSILVIGNLLGFIGIGIIISVVVVSIMILTVAFRSQMIGS